VGIGTDESIGVINVASGLNAFGEVFQVDLVDDADAGRYDFEGVEGLHAPFQELIALAVALKFDFEILAERVGRPGEVDLNGMVDHEVDGHERFDDFGVFSEARDGRTHGGEVHQQRNAGEILQNNAGDDEGNFLGALGSGFPIGELAHAGFGDFFAIAIAQHGFQDDADGDGQFGNGTDA